MFQKRMRLFFIATFALVFCISTVNASNSITKPNEHQTGIAKNVDIQIIKNDKGDITQETYKNTDGSTGEIKRTLNGKLEGLQETFNHKGQLRQTTDYSDGLKHGLDTRYHDDGTLFYMFTYIEGKKIGPFKDTPEGYKDEYYVLDEGFYDEQGRKTGKLKRYLALKKDVLASNNTDYDRWLLTSGEYERGKRSGTWTEFESDGLITKETIYLDDANNIYSEKEYFEKSKQLKSHTEYDRVKEQGFEQEYYSNGQLQSVKNHKGNDLSGAYEQYYENGQLRLAGEYSEGDQTGNWKEYDNSGLILKDYIYTDISCCLAFKRIDYKYNSDGKLESITTRNNLKENKADEAYIYVDVLYKYYNIENGSLKKLDTRKRFLYENGKSYLAKHGEYQVYTSEGKIITDGHYNKDKKDGEWAEYNSEGELKTKTTYILGEKIGPFEEYTYFKNNKTSKSVIGVKSADKTLKKISHYYSDGQIKETGEHLRTHKKDLSQSGKEGEWKAYHENGHLKSTGNYTKGFKQGKWTYYYDNKEVKATGAYLLLNTKTEHLVKKLKEDAKDGVWKNFDENGTLIEKAIFQVSEDYEYLVKELKNYYANGKLKSEELFHNEDKSGVHKNYFQTGELSSKDTYENNNICLTEKFYLSGILKSVSKYDCLDSYSSAKVSRHYFENEQLQIEVTYDDYGDVYNVLQYFNIDGQALEIGTLKDGYGTFNQYDDDNEIIEVETYEEGQIVEKNSLEKSQ